MSSRPMVRMVSLRRQSTRAQVRAVGVGPLWSLGRRLMRLEVRKSSWLHQIQLQVGADLRTGRPLQHRARALGCRSGVSVNGKIQIQLGIRRHLTVCQLQNSL